MMRIKQHAKILTKKLLEDHNITIKHTSALDIVSQMYGYDNWDHALNEKHTPKQKINIPPKPIPQTLLEEFHQNWEPSSDIGETIFDIYYKCKSYVNKSPLQPSLGKVLWDEFFKTLQKMFVILCDVHSTELSEITSECGIYTSIEKHHPLYEILSEGRTQRPSAYILLWKDPENDNNFYLTVEDIKKCISTELAICYTIAHRYGSVGNVADMMFFLRHGEV